MSEHAVPLGQVSGAASEHLSLAFDFIRLAVSCAARLRAGVEAAPSVGRTPKSKVALLPRRTRPYVVVAIIGCCPASKEKARA